MSTEAITEEEQKRYIEEMVRRYYDSYSHGDRDLSMLVPQRSPYPPKVMVARGAWLHVDDKAEGDMNVRVWLVTDVDGTPFHWFLGLQADDGGLAPIFRALLRER